MELIRHGKVRDVYADGDDSNLVASDRVSVYDVVLPTPIPDKGAILTQLSLWWFIQVADLVPNHVLADDVPPEWKGRATSCRRLLEMVPVECIARGYLGPVLRATDRRAPSRASGSHPVSLRRTGCRNRSSRRLPRPRSGSDEFMTMEMVTEAVGETTANDLSG